MRFSLKFAVIMTALFAGVAITASSCGDTPTTGGSGSGTSSGGSCTPGQTDFCACPGGMMGVQTCLDTETFGPCDCGGGTGGAGGSASTSSGNMSTSSGAMTCGNGMQDPGECGPEGTCPMDCGLCGNGMEDMNECGPNGTCAQDCCLPANTLIYGGKINMKGPVFAYNGLSGKDAADAECKSLGYEAMCTYEQLKKAEMENELTGVAANTTFWAHRTMPALDANGNMSQPGPGGRCNDWTYATNHISDGEYCVVNAGGTLTCYIDNDTVFDAAMPGAHTIPGQLECGGQIRDIPCCYPVCVPPAP